ncbi:hypothetical protein EJB05_51527, partial [Eragrostis curvula]
MALNAASKMNYLACVHILALLSQHFDPPRTGTSTGRSSQLPCVDVSILATEYPLDRHATRPTSLTTAGRWSTIYHEALQETAKFAALWKPFCQQHRVEPRAPKSYFAAKVAEGPHAGDSLRVHCRRSRGGSRQSRPTSGADLRTATRSCAARVGPLTCSCRALLAGRIYTYLFAGIAMMEISGWAGLTLLGWGRNERFYVHDRGGGAARTVCSGSSA